MADIFENAGDQPGKDTDTNHGEDNPLDQLVGEGKKFRTVEDLARGKIHSDKYIQQLTTALEDASSQLKENDHIESLLNDLRQRKSKTPDTDGNADDNRDTNVKGGDQTTKTEVGEEDLERLVESALTRRERENTAARNREVATQAIINKVGEDKAVEYMRNRAQELGMTTERLRELAGESPTAFSRLLGLEGVRDDKQRATTPHDTRVRAEGMELQGQNQGERTETYYMNLRKSDRSKFYSPATQAQMYKDADRLGDKFFDAPKH